MVTLSGVKFWASLARVFVWVVTGAGALVLGLGIVVLLTDWIDVRWFWLSAILVAALGGGLFFFDADMTRLPSADDEPGFDPAGWESESLGSPNFEELVRRAVDALPADLQAQMSNVEIVVESEPPPGTDRLGFYHGVPLTSRGSRYN